MGPGLAGVALIPFKRRILNSENSMNQLRRIGQYLLLSIPGLLFYPISTSAQSAPAATEQAHDGQHDFDFHFGTWKTHIKRLVGPLSGSTTWVELNGTVTVRKVWNGRANLEELEASNAASHFQGLTLFLYNPQSHQWSQTFSNINAGTLSSTPLIGEFKNGRGELYSQEAFNGRVILVRFVWSDITPNSHHVEQSFSDDGGKTWEPNFIADLTRVTGESIGTAGPVDVQKNLPASGADRRSLSAAAKTESRPSATQRDGQSDFDFHFGTWKTHITRLLHPLKGDTVWVEYDGISVVREVWGGRASLFELSANGPAGHIEGMGLRLYNPESHQWSLNWSSGASGVLDQPMVGEFKDGSGDFFDREAFNGRTISTRNGFSEITKDSSRFEQAFSDDGGKTWETNWIMTFTRVKDVADNSR
jgi:BNR/Asp-box repeat